MPELWLRRIFPRVFFLNSDLPENCYKLFKTKSDIEELPIDSTDLFQRNMLDRYLDCPNESFRNGEDKVTDKLCFAEFLSLYYIKPKLVENENDSQPVILYDELMKLNHTESKYSQIMPLMSSKEKSKCRKVKESRQF